MLGQDLILQDEVPLRRVQICYWPLRLSSPLELQLRRRTFTSCGVLWGWYCLSSSFLLSSGRGYVCSSESWPPAADISVLSGKHLSLVLSVQVHPP